MQFLVSKTQSSNKETKNYTSLWINGMKTQKRRQKIDHLEVWRSESWVKRDKNNPRTWITSKKCIIKTKLSNNLAGGTPASQTRPKAPRYRLCELWGYLVLWNVYCDRPTHACNPEKAIFDTSAIHPKKLWSAAECDVESTATRPFLCVCSWGRLWWTHASFFCRCRQKPTCVFSLKNLPSSTWASRRGSRRSRRSPLCLQSFGLIHHSLCHICRWNTWTTWRSSRKT